MSDAEIVSEHITKAIHSLDFAYSDLRDANGKAKAVESLILLDIIGQVMAAKHRLEALQSARQSK
jgi:hypothetical protein